MRRGPAAVIGLVVVLSLPCALACGVNFVGAGLGDVDGGSFTEDAGEDSGGVDVIGPPSDGSAPDDVVTVDAALDGASDVDANTPWCLTASHRLCADFEDNTFAGATAETSSNGQVSFTTAGNSFAGLSSLSASVVPADSTNRARINFPSLAVLANTLRFEGVFRVDSSATSGGLTYLFTIQDTDVNVYGVRLAIDASGNLGVVLTGPGAPQPTIIGPIPATWFHAVIDMSPNQVVVRIDNGTPHTFAWSATPPSNIILKLGLVGAGGVSSAIRIDNVALD